MTTSVGMLHSPGAGLEKGLVLSSGLPARPGLAARAGAVWAYRDLVWHLTLRDLRHKYKGSALGFVWSLANPLLMAIVYTIAFKYIVRIPIERFPLFVVSGLLPWTFFMAGVSSATSSIVDNGGLVRKVAFPRAALPIAAVLAQFVQFLLTYVVVVPALALADGGMPASLLGVVPVMILQLVFTCGLGLILAVCVRARPRHAAPGGRRPPGLVLADADCLLAGTRTGRAALGHSMESDGALRRGVSRGGRGRDMARTDDAW